MTETNPSEGAAVLTIGEVATILCEQGEECNAHKVGYYKDVRALVEKVASSKHWDMGEIFVFAPNKLRYLILKQIAPASCEMLVITNLGYQDVVTAYRYELQELIATLTGYMHPKVPKEVIERIQSALMTSGWVANAGGAIATKTYDTAVGKKQAIVHVGGDEFHYSLWPNYQSEGGNILSCCCLIPRDADRDSMYRLVDNFSTNVDKAVAESYAGRLMPKLASLK